MLREVVRWVVALAPQRRFYHKCHVWMRAGQIKEYCRLLQAASALPGEK